MVRRGVHLYLSRSSAAAGLLYCGRSPAGAGAASSSWPKLGFIIVAVVCGARRSRVPAVVTELDFAYLAAYAWTSADVQVDAAAP